MSDTLQTTVTYRYAAAVSTNPAPMLAPYSNTYGVTQAPNGVITVPTSPFTVSFGSFTSAVASVFVVNEDSTNTLKVQWKDAVTATVNTATVQPLGSFKLDATCNLAYGLVLTANTAAVQAFYMVAGT